VQWLEPFISRGPIEHGFLFDQSQLADHQAAVQRSNERDAERCFPAADGCGYDVHPIAGPAAERRVVNHEILERSIARVEEAVAYAAIELGGQHRLITQLVKSDNGRLKLSTE